MSNMQDVVIAGIRLPTFSNSHQNEVSLIYDNNSSSYQYIQQLALAVSCHRPVLLQGPVGSGKTSTVEYLADATGHKSQYNADKDNIIDSTSFLKVQLGEQTDSRMLLGSYQCTEIPGQFVWAPGILTQAVLHGCWILLEDIDCTSSDVVTVIDNLIKTQSLCVPGYSDNIIPHPDFQLFATQRTLRHDFSSGVKQNILKHWYIIQLQPLSSSEIAQIISKKYPKLHTIASRMVSVLDLECFSSQTSSRIPSVRDILKWCDRCHQYYQNGDPESAIRIFHDAVDVFCGHMDCKLRSSVSEQVGTSLGIVKNKANFLNPRYKPSIVVAEKFLRAGRSYLERHEDENVVMTSIQKNLFSLTAPSCRLIEKVACCLENNEPVLLVGETGCGKTTVLQYLAQIIGRKLIVINMNQQSDTTDLIGGFKPVTFKWIMKPLCDEFEVLFRDLFDAEKNSSCLTKFSSLIKKQNWNVLMKFIMHVHSRALIHIKKKMDSSYETNEGEAPRKRCKVDEEVTVSKLKWKKRLSDWENLGILVTKLSTQLQVVEKSLVFSFIEGSLVKAVKEGYWVLLDEINLATSETLDCLSGLLEGSHGSLSLLEKGESKPIKRNPGFRLFAAMNPATDVGKKQLPVGLRNRFTEFFIDELDDKFDLMPIVEIYLRELNQPPEKLYKVVKFYLNVKSDASNPILDGNGKKPHYSLRNLCRALMVASKNPCGNIPRSLYEGLSLSFLTQLDNKSYEVVHSMIVKAVSEDDIKSVLKQPIPEPSSKNCINLEGFWIPQGNLTPTVPDNYILTPTVKRHFKDLVRIVSLGSGIPVLLEGDTSVGKTSLITYLAKCTGNFCARVNNHEHTDIQEYIGTYVADSHGKLVFKEGILCEAMRKGYWLILDELNLAPTEVLEALNRVLDDNRELFVPETQTTIKAHEKFILFATQNPPGMYGGRKVLSRAFRNRFVEIQFDQIPADELVTILEKRCQMPLSYCKKMVAVMTELQLRRRGSEIFIGKSGFITLRDLFRWGERYQKAQIDAKFHDWEQHLADEGYVLLAGRVRVQEERKVIEEVISKHFRRKTDPENLFSLHENTSFVSRKILENMLGFSSNDEAFKHIVWTYTMRRLAVLVCKALEFSEPVLLVGETGCGKTTVVQILSKMLNRELYSVNCHMHSESADFLGGLRPVREESRAEGKLFEWCDGPLVQAMESGSFFLADEISLADDSVLERLNSLLEPERTILLTEKGGDLKETDTEEHVTVAAKDFQFVGTMNPGGDYGKKELSPALRNRFTEIWVETNENKFDDYGKIIEHNLNVSADVKPKFSEIMIKFLKWFKSTEYGRKTTISIRDILTWVGFMNNVQLNSFESCIHGCFLTFLDSLGSGSDGISDSEGISQFRRKCVLFLCNEIKKTASIDVKDEFLKIFDKKFVVTDEIVGIEPFFIAKGREKVTDDSFVFAAPTTFSNTVRLLRGLQTSKAILLEGSPGVGKTSLVSALAKASGYKLTRINLSDQTDVSDLFGADLPEEGASAGRFVWRDGPFLTALKEGHWILLDELNLASQSVLEGLNAVLDHRGAAYVPELDKTFHVSKQTRLFGCQNPLKEGGNRRGLPKSFLNRFTQVCVEVLTTNDYVIILSNLFPNLSLLKIGEKSVIEKMVEFNSELRKLVSGGKIGVVGGPWELNLRDLTRWAEGIADDLKSKRKGISLFNRVSGEVAKPEPEFSVAEENVSEAVFKYMNLLYLNRFRKRHDREVIRDVYVSVFGDTKLFDYKPNAYVTENHLIVGRNVIGINKNLFYGDLNDFEIFANSEYSYDVKNPAECDAILKSCAEYRGKRKLEQLRLLERQYEVLGFLSQCVNMNWLTILVGETGTGKTCCVRTLAALTGQNLRIMSNNSAMDTTEILGGFEQTDYNRHLDEISESARILVLSVARHDFFNGKANETVELLSKWSKFCELPINGGSELPNRAYDAFLTRLEFLQALLNSDLDQCKQYAEMRQLLCDRLDRLRSCFMSEDRLTCGGKFEWVDSMLVKSLKDGSWLLMEDVNLCSNAVLDRLNCLLEPNGVLTIGERGARADGSLDTIKPHPQFRLFFTMDPKNGVISRAMRNRGVEIYLRSDDETKPWPRLDVITLLSDSGIKDCDAQLALIETHSRFQNRSISSLVSNGFWINQYLKNGFSKSQAFAKSTKQIYQLSTDECTELVASLSAKLSSDRIFSLHFIRPNLHNYLIDPDFAKLKQSCGLLRLLIEILQNGLNLSDDEKATKNITSIAYPDNSIPSDVLGYLFDVDYGEISISDVLKLTILSIYMTINAQAAGISVEFIRKNLDDLKGLKNWKNVRTDLMKLLETLSGVVLQDGPGKNDLPWDIRWFSDIYAVCNGYRSDKVNNTLLLLKYLFNKILEPAPISAKSTEMTLTQYSKSVEEGYLEDGFPDRPIVSKFREFLRKFDEFALELLRWDKVKMNDDRTTWVLNNLKWRFRLGSQGESVLLVGTERKAVAEDTLTKLDLHLSWFDKSMLAGIVKALPRRDLLHRTLDQKYAEFSEVLSSVLSSENLCYLYKISNNFRRRLGQPLPDEQSNREESSESMEVDGNDDFGDDVILKSVSLSFLTRYHCDIVTDIKNNTQTSKLPTDHLELLQKLEKFSEKVRPVRLSLEKYHSGDLNEKHKLSSELMYHLMRYVNFDYEFHREFDDVTKNAYVTQILPFHRPVWTFHTLKTVFKDSESWSLFRYKESRHKIADLTSSIISNATESIDGDDVIDPKMKERVKMKKESIRVLNCLKEILSDENERKSSLRDLIKMKFEKAENGIEKRFYERIRDIADILEVENSFSIQNQFEELGCYWTLLGLLEFVILHQGKVDPIRKKLIKAEYAEKEVKELKTEIKAHELNGKITGANQNHLYVKNLKDRLASSEKDTEKYSSLRNVQRDPKMFQELSADVDNFLTQFGDRIYRFSKEVLEFFGNQSKTSKSQLYQTSRIIVITNKKFADKFEKQYVKYFADIAYPVLAASAQIEHGMNLITSELLRRQSNVSTEDVNSLIIDLCKYPVLNQKDLSKSMTTLTNILHRPDVSNIKHYSNVLMLFSSCIMKCNEWLTYRNNFKFNELLGMFSLVVEFWKKQEKKKEEEEFEKQSLYLRKGVTKCVTTPEDEELKEEQARIFPSFEADFEEDVKEEEKKLELGLLTNENLSQISKLHMRIVKQYVKLSWMSGKADPLELNFLRPLQMRFTLLSNILSEISFMADRDVDRRLIPGLLVLIHNKESGAVASDVKLGDDELVYDFYKDKNIEEVNRCLEIIQNTRTRVGELLAEWPDHPSLVQMNAIMERILSFPVDSPVMRFLTGLELLLQSCQHWESTAHSGVSISEHMIALTNIIIEWRRLELQGWKNCLQIAHLRMKMDASKWWYHLWCLVEEYMAGSGKSGSKEGLDELLKALYNFVETSPIGEFETRLDMLLSFHFHVIMSEASKRRDVLAIAFWNLYSFYHQYLSEVTKKLSSLSAPVFKKLKEYVKIAKWHDITYWSVKQSVEKSHKTLTKFIKEYETILKEPVRLSTFDPNNSIKEKTNQDQDITAYLSKIRKETFGSISFEDFSLGNPQGKLTKARKYCDKIVLTASYPNLIVSLEELSEEIHENVENLRNLEADKSLPEEKRKSQAKSILQRKRRALADLFKTLQQLGLSYKSGLMEDSVSVFQLYSAPPVNFTRATPGKLTGEEYYLKSFARTLALQNSLLTPSKEIGPQIIERLRGYAEGFMELNRKQKLTLCQAEANLSRLETFEAALTSIVESPDFSVPNQKLLSEKSSKLKEIVDDIFYLTKQFSHVLDSWPTGNGEKMKRINYSAGNLTPEIMTSAKNDECYIATRQKFDNIVQSLLKLRDKLDKNFSDETVFNVRVKNGVSEIIRDEFAFYNDGHRKLLDEISGRVRTVVDELRDFRKIFENEKIFNPLIEDFRLLDRILEDYDGFEEIWGFEDKEDEDEILNKVRLETEKLVTNILLAVQNVLKRHQPQEKDDGEKELEKGDDKAEDEEDFSNLLDDHLKGELVKNLESDLNDLNMSGISRNLESIFNHLSGFSLKNDSFSIKDNYFRFLLLAGPFIKQYLLLCSYFVEQQKHCYRASNKLCSILLGVFIQVAQKGFCTPQDLMDEEGESFTSKEGGGFGAGDGEGKKDVSEKIESEDQLEDALPQGSERNDEPEPDCKEEEKGIEMSENFDAKLQDVEEKDNEDEESENDEEPSDKEMGDTDQNVEKLDKQLWDSEAEDEEEDEKKEEKGHGEETDVDRYAPKENDDENDDEEENSDPKGERKQKQKDINEMKNPENDEDHVDPYHGHQEPDVEPEPLNLPEDLQLDEGGAEEEGENEQNPFDIDAMKEPEPPKEPEEEPESQEKKENEGEEDSSDEEGAEEKGERQKNEEMEVDKEEEEDEGGDEAKGGEKMEDEGEEDEKKQKEIPDDYQPSDDKPAEEAAQPAPEENETASKDEVAATNDNKEKKQEAQDVSEKTKEEVKGTGQAEVEDMSKGHDADLSKKEKLQANQSNTEKKKKRERPGKSDQDRSLGDVDNRLQKKLKTIDKIEINEEEEDEDGGKEDAEEEEADMYQHIKDSKEQSKQVLDAATKEQAETQPTINKDEEEEAEEATTDDVVMEDEEMKDEQEDIPKQKSSKTEGPKDPKEKSNDKETDGTGEEVKNELNEGEVVQTSTVERGPETTFHTQPLNDEMLDEPQMEDLHSLRLQIQEQLSSMHLGGGISSENAQAWQLVNSAVDNLARDLSEQLRLVLEPSLATRLKGDYRTGRRINMRKVIGYIASEFRKDRIWLRRTKPWKREHEIVLAIDDSSSMKDNKSKELAFESLALVSKALRLLEAGQLGVLSFGEKTRILHKLGDPFTDETGARLLNEFTFEQTKTLVSEVVDVSSAMLSLGRRKEESAKLLLIVSDGRGVFSEGLEKIKMAVRRATDLGIFLVFLIIDNPQSRDSIVDIRMPEFKDGKFLRIRSYMEQFPFPYYLILRDINALPNTLSDALRQWFQLITSSTSR